MEPGTDDSNLRAICLCAEWCGVCREWRATFQAEAASRDGVAFSWIDVEDEAPAMGDVDIETFPTLLIARGENVIFFGPVQPSAVQFTRLLTSLQASASPASPDPEAAPLLQRLLAGVLSKR
jgi:hypothetical protein